MKTFLCKIIKQNAVVFSEEITSLTINTINGLLSILARHEPFFTQLTDGKAEIKHENGLIKEFKIQSSGFLQVTPQEVTLYVEEISEIDKKFAVLWKKLPKRKLNKTPKIKKSFPKTIINFRKKKIFIKPSLFFKFRSNPIRYLPFKIIKNKGKATQVIQEKPKKQKEVILSLDYITKSFLSFLKRIYDKI